MKNINEINVQKVADFINNLSTDTKVYIGCDSTSKKKNGRFFATFSTVVVVHMDGNKGCRIFNENTTLPDYDKKKNRPNTRMMNEVYKATEMFLKLSPLIAHDIEIHLDINPDEKHGSNCAYNEALGYVMGVCSVEPKFKPEAFAASFAADKTIS